MRNGIEYSAMPILKNGIESIRNGSQYNIMPILKNITEHSIISNEIWIYSAMPILKNRGKCQY